MEKEYTYLYKDSRNRKYASEPDYNASADIDVTKAKDFRELINLFLKADVPFTIGDKTGTTYLDIIYCDTSDENNVKFICKWVSQSYVRDLPMFSTDIGGTGLVEQTLEYSKLMYVAQMNPGKEGKMMSNLREKYPEYYEFLENRNKVEGVDLKAMNVKRDNEL